MTNSSESRLSDAPLSEAQISAILRGMDLPPCPSVLGELSVEMRRERPSPVRIAQLIGSDVALSAGVLKIANAPQFGASKAVTSIPEALTLLGVRNVFSLVINELLRKTLVLAEPVRGLERYWDTAAYVARVCSELSRMLPGTTPDVAYTFGLFCNCGIPILMRRFPTYRETLLEALAPEEKTRTAVEDRLHGTNHAVVGYLMARSWGLPDVMSQAIRTHHDFCVFDMDANLPEESLSLIGLHLVAERVVGLLFGGGDEDDWWRGRRGVAGFFGRTPEEIDDLVEDMVAVLERIARCGGAAG